MTDSQTRREWRTRISAILLAAGVTEDAREKGAEYWLSDLMQTEPLRLAELAEEKGGTLAAVDGVRAYARVKVGRIIALAEAAGEVAEPPDSCPEASCPERRGDCHKCYVQPHWAAGDAGARS